MWRTVLKLEWRILRRDKAALGVLGIFAAFLIVAAVAGGRYASTLSDGLDKGDAQQSDRFDSLRTELAEKKTGPLGAKDARDPAWMGQEGAARLATLPPAPLAPVAVGQRDLHPQAVRVTTDSHLTSERETETPMSGPTRLMTGAFDPAFLFVVLFPLVIIALSYELLSGERERGTLAMLLSQPVTQGSLVLGKAGARAIALCGVTIFFALAGLLIAGADLTAPGALLQAGLYALILVAWAIFWFAAAVAVNAFGSTSARNALLLVGLWLIIVVVAPGLIHVGVDAVYPAPSRIELMHEAREAARDVEQELDGLEGRHDAPKERLGDAAKGTSFQKRVVEVQEELAKRSEPILVELRTQLRHRQSIVDNLRFISPAIIVQLALEDVAGSGAARHQQFEDQVDAYHDVFQAFFFDRVRAGRTLSAGDLDAIPTMTFTEEPASSLLFRVLPGLLVLLLLATFLVVATWPRLRKVGRLAR